MLKQGPEQGSLAGLGLLGTKEGLLSPAPHQAGPQRYSWPCTDSLGDLAEKGSHTQLCLPAKAIMVS